MKRFCIFLAAAVSVFNVSAGVRMPRFFSDNMVLQRDMPVRVWGRASAGDTVEVRLGGTAAAAVADSSGRWLAELPPMQPGGPFEMSVEGPDSTLVFGNVMIGDVWLCSGQSNMEWPLDMTEGSAEEIAASSCPAIRLLTVGRNCTPDEQEDIAAGSWEECSPETSPDFSAVAYYFGRFVYRQTGVPVGPCGQFLGRNGHRAVDKLGYNADSRTLQSPVGLCGHEGGHGGEPRELGTL